MKMKKTLSLCLAAGLAVSSTLAMAQGGPPRDNNGGPGGQGGPQGQRPGGPGGPGGGQQAQRPPQGGPGGGNQGHRPQVQPPRGHAGGPGRPGPGGPDNWQHPDWRRGDRMPQQYRGHNYVIDNYRDYRLGPPPRGYHWVGVGGDFLLVAITTGVISQIVLGAGR